MKIAPKPANEQERLNALNEYHILDTPAERDFDEIAELASIICETSISTVTLIDEARQWFKAKVGLDTPETSRDIAFCSHVINQDSVMIVPDASKDDRFHDNPLVTGNPDIRFYAGMPLVTPDGYNIGTLCVIDTKPKNLLPHQLFALQVLSKQVIKQMELRKKVFELERLNDTHRKLLSVIGHDLRSPLTSLYGLLELSEKYDLPPEEFKAKLPEVRQGFTAANSLLGNLLEWATSQFEHNGIKRKIISLRYVVDQIIADNQQQFDKKNNEVENLVDTTCQVLADEHMLRTVLRNLLMNANKFTNHGRITISNAAVDTMTEICIADTGVGMDQLQVSKMFNWDKRTSTKGTSGERGSGFGLLVSQEFVEKNGGRMWVESVPMEGSKFYFTLHQYHAE
ncbi:MAG: GAF domain-containing sensor histidine kinase [Cyclobacteriaceae bacterium]|nr:GAF domain-containing sensor histidine kinase [Cyclobacteriaceae bacterium]